MRIMPSMLMTSVLAIGAIALNAGCRTVNTSEREDPIGIPNPVADKRVETDSGLRGIARIVSIRESETADGRIIIQVEVLNTNNTQKRFNYMFEWYDLNGIRINTPLSIWKPQQIQGKEVILLSGVGPDSSAKDFRLKLIEGK